GLDAALGQPHWQLPKLLNGGFQASGIAPVWDDGALYSDAASGALVADPDGRVAGTFALPDAAGLALERVSVVPGAARASIPEKLPATVMAVSGGRMYLTSRSGM